MQRNCSRHDAAGLLRQIGWRRALAIGCLLCGSSCSSVSQYVKQTFHHGDPPVVARTGKDPAVQAEARHAEAAAKNEVAKTAKTDHRTPENKPAAPAPSESGLQASATGKPAQSRLPDSSPTGDSKPDVLKLIAQGQDPFAASMDSMDSSVKQVSAEAPAMVNPQTADAISFEPEPRAPLNPQLASLEQNCPASPVAACPPGNPCSARPFPGMESAADEYVCDGGDKQEPVHYEGQNRAGLNLEDTIAEYQDETGKMHVKASTEACIYAPRFGEVRSTTLPEEGLSIAKAQGHQDQASAGGLETRTATDEKVQWDEIQDMRTRSRASGLDARAGEGQLDKAISARTSVKLTNVYEDFRFIQEGQFDRVSTEFIAQSVDAALEWADGRRPIMIAQDQSGQVIQSRAAAEEYVGVEDRRTPGELKLLKVADKSSAHPGDLVTFTIRFDNVGGRDLLKVRIVDNLSPRLQFVDGSISSNFDGALNVTDNGAGGKLLTFEFDQPLKGKTGGFISFQCKVR